MTKSSFSRLGGYHSLNCSERQGINTRVTPAHARCAGDFQTDALTKSTKCSCQTRKPQHATRDTHGDGVPWGGQRRRQQQHVRTKGRNSPLTCWNISTWNSFSWSFLQEIHLFTRWSIIIASLGRRPASTWGQTIYAILYTTGNTLTAHKLLKSCFLLDSIKFIFN